MIDCNVAGVINVLNEEYSKNILTPCYFLLEKHIWKNFENSKTNLIHAIITVILNRSRITYIGVNDEIEY